MQNPIFLSKLCIFLLLIAIRSGQGMSGGDPEMSTFVVNVQVNQDERLSTAYFTPDSLITPVRIDSPRTIFPEVPVVIKFRFPTLNDHAETLSCSHQGVLLICSLGEKLKTILNDRDKFQNVRVNVNEYTENVAGHFQFHGVDKTSGKPHIGRCRIVSGREFDEIKKMFFGQQRDGQILMIADNFEVDSSDLGAIVNRFTNYPFGMTGIVVEAKPAVPNSVFWVKIAPLPEQIDFPVELTITLIVYRNSTN